MILIAAQVLKQIRCDKARIRLTKMTGHCTTTAGWSRCPARFIIDFKT